MPNKQWPRSEIVAYLSLSTSAYSMITPQLLHERATLSSPFTSDNLRWPCFARNFIAPAISCERRFIVNGSMQCGLTFLTKILDHYRRAPIAVATRLKQWTAECKTHLYLPRSVFDFSSRLLNVKFVGHRFATETLIGRRVYLIAAPGDLAMS